MRRREFIAALGSVAVWPLAARAQLPAQSRLVGLLMGFSENDPAAQSLVSAFRDAFAKLGWIEGSNLRLEIRWGNGSEARIATSAKELVNLRPDVILGQTTAVVTVPARETRDIPIVFTFVTDPISSHFVASFAQSGRQYYRLHRQ
jgi:putative tryptophan/tyrosine transport system substrate-binding protein